MTEIKEYKNKLVQELKSEKDTQKAFRLKETIAYLDSEEMELKDTIRDILRNAERILHNK